MEKLILPEPITLLDRVHNLGKPRAAEEAQADLEVYLKAKRALEEQSAKVAEGLLNRRGGVNLGLSAPPDLTPGPPS